MYKFMQKNKKKLLAIFGAGLMIIFILPTAAFDRRHGTSQEVIGHLGDNKEEVTAGQLRQAAEQWRMLLPFRIPEQLPHVRMIAADVERNPEFFYLLQREARQMGLRVPDEAVNNILRELAQISQMTGNRITNVEGMKAAISNVMLVENLMGRTAAGFKTSEPRVMRELTQNLQRIKLDLVHYSAEDFKAGLAAPTAEQLQKQFDDYKSTAPGSPTDANPFGFGYLVPSRVKLAYLTVPRDEVVQAVRKSQPEIEWEIQAVPVYNANSGKYAATQPVATQPAATTTTAATTGPTAPRWGSLGKAERELVIRDVLDPLVNKKTDEIGNALGERLKADYEAVQRKSAGAPADLGTRAYLDRVVADFEKTYGVKLGVSEINDPKDEAGLRELKGIGQSFAGEQSFPQTVMRWAEVFTPADQRTGSDVLSPNEPSRAFRDLAGNVYVFHVREAIPAAAPANLDAVKDKVEADVRTKLAFEAAVAAAKKLSESAQNGKLAEAAKTAGKDLVTTPAFLDRQSSMFGAPQIIPAVELPDASSQQLLTKAFDLLGRATPEAPHPGGVIELPAAGRVVVAQLGDVERLWPDEGRDLQLYLFGERMSQERSIGILLDYFKYDVVKKRMNYHAANEAPPTETAAAN